jgi:hypothetical protein
MSRSAMLISHPQTVQNLLQNRAASPQHGMN